MNRTKVNTILAFIHKMMLLTYYQMQGFLVRILKKKKEHHLFRIVQWQIRQNNSLKHDARARLFNRLRPSQYKPNLLNLG